MVLSLWYRVTFVINTVAQQRLLTKLNFDSNLNFSPSIEITNFKLRTIFQYCVSDMTLQ